MEYKMSVSYSECREGSARKWCFLKSRTYESIARGGGVIPSQFDRSVT